MEIKTFVQDLGRLHFFVHCTRDADYIMKIMLTHGVLK